MSNPDLIKLYGARLVRSSEPSGSTFLDPSLIGPRTPAAPDLIRLLGVRTLRIGGRDVEALPRQRSSNSSDRGGK